MKKVLIGFGVGFTLLLAAVLLAPSFIDWSGYRAEIASKIKEATGRELIIGGDVAFSLLPSPVLKVADLRLANAPGASNQDMVSVEQLDVRIAFLPLLGGNLHINSIRLIRPVIQLEVLENGRGNWLMGQSANEDSPQTSQPSDDPAFVDSDSATAAPLPLQIDDFIIEQGQLTFWDKSKDIHETIEEINSRFAIAGLNGPFEAAGTLRLRGIPVGFEGSVGQIVHGRTASFASQIRFAHGNTQSRITGTLVNLPQGPKVSTKIDFKGDSLAGFLSAFQPGQKTLPGALDRTFSARGEMTYDTNGLTLGTDGMVLTMGEDRGKLHVDFHETSDKQNLKVRADFSKINGDIWQTTDPYNVVAPDPLPPVIKLSDQTGKQGSRVSAALDNVARNANDNDNPNNTNTDKKPASPLPEDLEASLAINIDALLFKGEAIRQAQTLVSLTQGEIALERLSAILPGAGELTMIGIAGQRGGSYQFDGTAEVEFSHVRGALKWLGLPMPNVPLDRLQQLSLSTDLVLNEDQLQLTNFNTRVDGSHLNGGITLALQKRPSFGASLVLDQLNLDAYLASKSAAPTTEQKTQQSTTPDSQTAANKTKTASPSPLEALKLLDSFDANVDMRLKQLTYRDQTIKDIHLDATIFDGGINIRQADIASLAGLHFEAKGSVTPKDSSYHADNLFVSLSGKNYQPAARLGGLDSLLDWKKVGAATANATLNGDLLAPGLDVNLDVLGSSLSATGQADLFPLPKGDAHITVSVGDLARLSNGLSLGYRPTGNPGKILINTDAVFNLQNITLKDIRAKAGEDRLSGQVDYTQAGGTRPVLKVALQAERLNLTPFLPAKAQAVSTPPKQSGSSQNNATGQAKTAKAQRWSRAPVDLSALNSMDGIFQLSAQHVQHKQTVLSDVKLRANLKNGILDVNDASAKLFGGQAQLTSKLMAQTQPATLNAVLKADGLRVSQALQQTGNNSEMDGRLSLNTNLSTRGQSEYDFINNLNGQGSLQLNNASVKGKGKQASPLALLNLLAVLSGSNPDKGLADVHVSSNIENGVAQLTQAALTSSIANGTAQGQIDLPDWTMDISGALNVKQNALTGLLAKKAKMKQSYPFSLKGPLDKPNVKLDTGGLSSGGGLIIPLPDKLEKKGVGNVIRGLLGGTSPSTPQDSTSNNQPVEQKDGTLAPPPPANTTPVKRPSVEEQLIKGLGDLLNR